LPEKNENTVKIITRRWIFAPAKEIRESGGEKFARK